MLLAALLVALQDPAPAAVAPRALGWDDFPVFVWRETYAGKPLPEELAEPFGGVILMREEDSQWARDRRLAYLVWNVAGREALHLDANVAWNERVEGWIRTQDPKLLVREPCPSDQATRTGLAEALEATLARHGLRPGLGFVLGDEVGLTPNGDPFDLCRCEPCEAQWREYATKHGLPARAPLTDEVRLDLMEDDFSTLGAWLARRRFEIERMTAVLAPLADAIRFPRNIPVGLLGIGGPSAFGSLDLGGGLPFIDFVETYAVRDARELLMTAPARERRSHLGYVRRKAPSSLVTLFPGQEGPDGVAWTLWEHWLRGGNAAVLWSDRALLALPAQVARLSASVAEIRALEQRFPRLIPPHLGPVALVADADSVALAWLKDALLDGATWPRRKAGYQEEHGTREQSVRAWLRWIEDQGVLPGALPLARIQEQHAWGINTLVLVHLLVLGPEDVAALEQALDLGKTLIVDGPLGWVDRAGQPWKEDVLKRLRARAPERVRLAPESMRDYLRTRLDPERPSAQGPVEIRTWRPSFAGDAGSVPWLVSVRLTSALAGHATPKEHLVATLPNLVTPDERARFLRPLKLELEPPAGQYIEWIHPREGAELPAGDAAVFLLHATDSEDPLAQPR